MLTVFSAKGYTFDDSIKTKPKNKNLVKTTNSQIKDSTLIKKNSKKDVFIDNDGDGICDKRARGMSFEKLRKRHGGKLKTNNNRGHRYGKK